MLENRRHFRLREFVDVGWKLVNQGVSGEGTIVNISYSGLLLQTDQVFRPTDNCILSIESGAGAEVLPFVSKAGRIVWFRRIHVPNERLQCGIQFLMDRSDRQFQEWLETKINQIAQAGDANILGNLVL